MGCTHTKEGRSSSSSKTKKIKDKRRERSERTVYSEPTYHIKTEDYKPNPPSVVEPSQHGSISRDNTVTLSSNKDENLDDGIDGREKCSEASTPHQHLPQQVQPQTQGNTLLPQQPEHQQEQDQPTLERKGSIVRNGIYYSESELSEENPWQPKYWTPDRIGKWVEDTEFPDGMKFHEVCKIVIQNNMTVPRPRAVPHHQSPVNHAQT